MQTFLYIVLGVVIGLPLGVAITIFVTMYSASKIEHTAVYKKGRIYIGGNAYLVIPPNEHPFYDGQRVDGLFELRKGESGGNPTTFATYKVHEYEPKIKC